MKSVISALFLIAGFTVAASAQESFKVIKVNGTILLKAKGTSLETGTVFSANEDLLFRSDDATAAVINSTKGMLILTNNNHDLASASSNYLPSMNNISTRAPMTREQTLSELPDLQNYFADRYVVLDRQSLFIDNTSFTMNDQNFFFLRYTFKNEDINKKLDHSGDSLIIDREKLYTVDGTPIPAPDNSTIMLFYRKRSESIWISNFDLIFPDQSQLKKEVKVILDEFRERSYREKITEVNGFISENYGKVQRANLVQWLGKNFGMKPE